MQSHMFLGKIIGLILVLLIAWQFYRGFRKSVLRFERENESLAGVSD